MTHNWTARQLTSDDIDSMRDLDNHCYPISYDDNYYRYASTQATIAMGCFQEDETLIGAVVARFVHDSKVQEGRLVAFDWTNPEFDPTVIYILTLGVYKQHRRKGVGRFLINHCITVAKQTPEVRAIFLHTELDNIAAHDFYCRNGFQQKCIMPEYYFIQGQQRDAVLYHTFINGGKPSSWYTSMESTLVWLIWWPYAALVKWCRNKRVEKDPLLRDV